MCFWRAFYRVGYFLIVSRQRPDTDQDSEVELKEE